MASWALHGPSLLRADSLACLALCRRAYARPGRALQRGAPVVDIDRRPCEKKQVPGAFRQNAQARGKKTRALESAEKRQKRHPAAVSHA
eukprot:344397-Alexandrium_andersonii.AAC.1